MSLFTAAPFPHPQGHYACSQCEHPLFGSNAKYNHSSPWPAFQATMANDSVKKREERKGTYKASLPNLARAFSPAVALTLKSGPSPTKPL